MQPGDPLWTVQEVKETPHPSLFAFLMLRGTDCITWCGLHLVFKRRWQMVRVVLMREKNKPFLQGNELCINSFLWSMWMMELSMSLQRQIRAGPHEDKSQPVTIVIFLNA